MYAQFTERAKKVMQLANQEAGRFNHDISARSTFCWVDQEGFGVGANA